MPVQGQFITAAQGGTVTLTTGPGAGAFVVIPPNALAMDTFITVQNGTAVDSPDAAAAGPAVQFGPSGTQFSIPATVSLPYMPGSAGPQDIFLMLKRNDMTGDIVPLDGTTGMGALTALTSSFSTFQAARSSTQVVVDAPMQGARVVPGSMVDVVFHVAPVPQFAGPYSVSVVDVAAGMEVASFANLMLSGTVTLPLMAPLVSGPYALRLVLSAGTPPTRVGVVDIAFVVNTTPIKPVLEIRPATPRGGEAINAVLITASEDADGDMLEFLYEWRRNGEATTYSEATIPAGVVARGDVWTVDVTASDGLASSPTGSASTMAATNGPPNKPVVTIRDTPSTVATGVVWNIGPCVDPDGDTVTMDATVRVMGNVLVMRSLNVAGDVVALPNVFRDQTFELVVVAKDSFGLESATVVVETVANRPPVIPAVDVAATGGENPFTLLSQLTTTFQPSPYYVYYDPTHGVDEDGDPVVVQYTWLINGQPAPTNGLPMGALQPEPGSYTLAQACGSAVKAGDSISVLVTATDQGGLSTTFTSEPVVLVAPKFVDFFDPMAPPKEVAPCGCANRAAARPNQTMSPVCTFCAPEGVDPSQPSPFYQWGPAYSVAYDWPRQSGVQRTYDARDCTAPSGCPMWDAANQRCSPGKWVSFNEPGEGYFKVPAGVLQFDTLITNGADGGEGGYYLQTGATTGIAQFHLGAPGGKGAKSIFHNVGEGGFGNSTVRLYPGRYVAFNIGAAGKPGDQGGQGGTFVDAAGGKNAGNGAPAAGASMVLGVSRPWGGTGGGGGGYTATHFPVGDPLPALATSNISSMGAGGGGGGGGGGPLSPADAVPLNPVASGAAGGAAGLMYLLAAKDGTKQMSMCSLATGGTNPVEADNNAWGGGGGGAGAGTLAAGGTAGVCGEAGLGGPGGSFGFNGQAAAGMVDNVVGGRMPNLGSVTSPAGADTGNGSVHIFYAPVCAAEGGSCANHGVCCFGAGSCEPNGICTQCAQRFQPCGGGTTCCSGLTCNTFGQCE